MTAPWLDDGDVRLYHGDARAVLDALPEASVDCCITSPPYFGLRDYGVEGQIGLEDTPEAFIERLVDVFRGVARVLRPEGTCWVNLGDSYAHSTAVMPPQNGAAKRPWQDAAYGLPLQKRDHGVKPKDLLMMPARLALALQADGWYLRSDIIWAKPNPMPESVKDRPTSAHEHVFLLTRSPRYWYDADAIKEPANGQNAHDLTGMGYAAPGQTPQNGNRARWPGIGPQHGATRDRGERYEDMQVHALRNARNVWTIATQPTPDAHFATFPEALVRRCLLAGCPVGGTVLDPFVGSGTTAIVARANARQAVGVELSEAYLEIARKRIRARGQMALEVA